MIHRKSIVHCSYAYALYPAREIQGDKCKLTRFATNFRFEDFSWILPRASTCGPRACSCTALS